MTETEFNEKVDEILMQIEDALDELDQDIELETAAGILTIIMPDQSQLIINRQGVARQLWLAARSGGYHFDYLEGNEDKTEDWIDERNGKRFIDTLNRCLSEQGDSSIELDL